jgi:putative membrane protein
MQFILKILVIAAVSFILSKILAGVHVTDFWTAIVFALVLALLNVFAKPLFIILTLPVTIFTLGLFLFVINALIVLLASRFVEGFTIDGFWWGLLFSLLLSVVMSLIDKQAEIDKRRRR